MKQKLPEIDHWSIEPDDVEALNALYEATPVADIPENWKTTCFEQLDFVDKADTLARKGLVEKDYQAAPPPQLVEITLPEIMQCFKTLVHFDWVQKLGSEFIAEGVLDIPYETGFVTIWPLEDPFERGMATGSLELFAKWWPIRCGYDVLTGPFGDYNRRYRWVGIPVYRAVLLKITYDDMDMVFGKDNFAWVVKYLRKYGAQK